MIQAIETEYNGYRFRSRMEARWAVFFDALGIEYQYEPEGFEFDDGTRYLPDFWLPGWRVWVEIKGAKASEQEVALADKLRRAMGNPVLIIQGSPYCENDYAAASNPTYEILYLDDEECAGAGYLFDGCFVFGECRKCSNLALIKESDRLGEEALLGLVLGECGADSEWVAEKCGDRLPLMTDRVSDALSAARSARFEFGETPTPRRSQRSELVNRVAAYAQGKNTEWWSSALPASPDDLMNEYDWDKETISQFLKLSIDPELRRLADKPEEW